MKTEKEIRKQMELSTKALEREKINVNQVSIWHFREALRWVLED